MCRTICAVVWAASPALPTSPTTPCARAIQRWWRGGVLPLIAGQAQQSSDLVTALLTLAKVGDKDLHKTHVDLTALAHEAIALPKRRPAIRWHCLWRRRRVATWPPGTNGVGHVHQRGQIAKQQPAGTARHGQASSLAICPLWRLTLPAAAGAGQPDWQRHQVLRPSPGRLH